MPRPTGGSRVSLSWRMKWKPFHSFPSSPLYSFGSNNDSSVLKLFQLWNKQPTFYSHSIGSWSSSLLSKLKIEKWKHIPHSRTHARSNWDHHHSSKRLKSYPSVTSAQLQIECKQANRTEPNRTEARQSIRSQETLRYLRSYRTSWIFVQSQFMPDQERKTEQESQTSHHSSARSPAWLFDWLT